MWSVLKNSVSSSLVYRFQVEWTNKRNGTYKCFPTEAKMELGEMREFDGNSMVCALFFMELCARFARFYSVMQIAPECSRFEWYKKVQTYPVQERRFKCKIALIINIDYIPIILLFYLLLPIVALNNNKISFKIIQLDWNTSTD